MTGRWFEIRTLTDYELDPRQIHINKKEQKLILRKNLRDILAITALSEAEDSLTEDTDYYIDKEIGALVRANYTPWVLQERPNGYKLTGNFGYCNYDADVDPVVELVGGTDDMEVGMQYRVSGATGFNSHVTGDIYRAVTADNTAFNTSTMKVIPTVRDDIKQLCIIMAAIDSGLWKHEFTTVEGIRGSSTAKTWPDYVQKRIKSLRVY